MPCARVELLKENTDFKLIDQALIEAKNDPSEVRAMALLFKRFRRISFFEQAIEDWSFADSELEKLKGIALELQFEIKNKTLSEIKRKEFLQQIFEIDQKLLKAEVHFSKTLSEAARWLKSLMMQVLGARTLMGCRP